MNLVTRSSKREQRSLPCVRKSETNTLCKILFLLLQLERFAVWEYQTQDALRDGSGLGWQSLVSAAITVAGGIWRGCLCAACFAWHHALCYLLLNQTFEKLPQWSKIASCHFLCFKTPANTDNCGWASFHEVDEIYLHYSLNCAFTRWRPSSTRQQHDWTHKGARTTAKSYFYLLWGVAAVV